MEEKEYICGEKCPHYQTIRKVKQEEPNEEEIEIKLNKEKQKLIRLVAVKDNKTFSKLKKENYKIGAVISNQK